MSFWKNVGKGSRERESGDGRGEGEHIIPSSGFDFKPAHADHLQSYVGIGRCNGTAKIVHH